MCPYKESLIETVIHLYSTPPAPLSHNAYAKNIRPAVLFKLKPCAVIAQCVGEFCYFSTKFVCDNGAGGVFNNRIGVKYNNRPISSNKNGEKVEKKIGCLNFCNN